MRETLAEQAAPRAAGSGTVFGADPYRSFREQFDEARKPGCLGPDALKHQPARIGPFQMGGLMALPFWAAAIARGKCT